MLNDKNWVIGICCSEADGVDVFRVHGTEAQVKKYLANCVQADREVDEDKYESGTESADQVSVDADTGELNAYGTYSDYHIDYTARIEAEPLKLDDEGVVIDQ